MKHKIFLLLFLLSLANILTAQTDSIKPRIALRIGAGKQLKGDTLRDIMTSMDRRDDRQQEFIEKFRTSAVRDTSVLPTMSTDWMKGNFYRSTVSNVVRYYFPTQGFVDFVDDAVSGIVTPEQYNAVGNGIADDAAALQAAINQANSMGVKQIFASKNYKINTPLSNPLGVQFVGGGRIVLNNIQLNSYADANNQLFFGIEYLSRFHKLLLASGAIKAVFSGDSTTQEGGLSSSSSSNNFVPLTDRLIEQLTGKTITSVNSGNSGQNTTQWLSTYLSQDSAQLPDLYILRWGINDALAGDISAFRTRYETGLQRLRAWRSDSLLSIVIMSPSSTSDSPNGRDEEWYEQVNYMLRELARKYRCAFFDTYQLARDSRSANNYMDNVSGANIHPADVMNTWIASELVQNIIPLSYRVSGGGGSTPDEVNNVSSSTILNGSELPNNSAFITGINIHRATVTSPAVDGMIITTRQVDGVAVQFLSDRTTSVSYYRTGQVATNLWSEWIVLGQKNGIMRQFRVNASTNIYENILYNNASANQTGTFAITLPFGFDNVNYAAEIEGYSASETPSRNWKVDITSFAHSTPISQWNVAQISGNAPFTSVRLARDATTNKVVILLGTTTTTWALPKIILRKMAFGHTNPTDAFAQSGFTSAWVTAESNYNLIATPTTYTTLNTVGGKLTSLVTVENNDVYINNTANGLIQKSANGNCWKLTVSDAGVITATSTTCPN